MSSPSRCVAAGRWKALAAASLVTCALLAPGVIAPDQAQADNKRLVERLEQALKARITVWTRPDGGVVYASHCRQAPGGGCEARLHSFAQWLADVSTEFDVDPFLMAAVAVRESGLSPTAMGGIGEWGIVQLHPRGAGANVRFVREESYRNRCIRSEPGACQDEVLRVGTELLANAITRCGDVGEGLGRYNTGHCRTTGYTDRVFRERDRLVSLAKGIEPVIYVD